MRARSGYMEEETETNIFNFVIKFLLEYSYFIMCLFLLHSKLNQPHTYTHTPSLLDFLHFQITTEHWVDFPGLYSRFSLVIHFTHIYNSIYMSIPISQFLLACHFPLGVHIFVLYINVSISVLQVRSILFI